jgi:hypothetical protein
MVRPGRDRLTGRVEVDETYLGGVVAFPGGTRLEREDFSHPAFFISQQASHNGSMGGGE